MESRTASAASARSLEDLVRAAVLRQRDPPRQARLLPLVLASYRSRVALLFLAVALLIGLPGVGVGLLAEGPGWASMVIVLVCAAAVLLFGGAPAIRAVRYHRAVRSGIVVAGEVLDSAWLRPGLRPPTIEAGLHGTTRGVRRVHHPQGAYDEPFECDAPWARELQPGTRLWLLADARRPQVLFDLGPASPP